MDWQHNERFKRLYPHVLHVEGGYVNDPEDPGGPTNHGIAFNYNQGYLKKFGIEKPTDIARLTKEQALEIYYRKYWIPSQADEIPDSKFALAYFDHVINAGQGAADQLLAKCDKNLWHYAGDGKNLNYWWPQTMRYMLHRLWFYFHIKNWGRYGLGWFNRLLHITQALGKV